MANSSMNKQSKQMGSTLAGLFLSAMVFLTACGKKDDPAPAPVTPVPNTAALCAGCTATGNSLLTGLTAGTTVYDTNFQPQKSAIQMNFNVTSTTDLATLNNSMMQTFGANWNTAAVPAYYVGQARIDGSLVVQPVVQTNSAYCQLPSSTYTVSSATMSNFSYGSMSGGQIQATDGSRTILMTLISAIFTNTTGLKITGSNVYLQVRIDTINGQPCNALASLSTGF